MVVQSLMAEHDISERQGGKYTHRSLVDQSHLFQECLNLFETSHPPPTNATALAEWWGWASGR